LVGVRGRRRRQAKAESWEGVLKYRAVYGRGQRGGGRGEIYHPAAKRRDRYYPPNGRQWCRPFCVPHHHQRQERMRVTEKE